MTLIARRSLCMINRFLKKVAIYVINNIHYIKFPLNIIVTSVGNVAERLTSTMPDFDNTRDIYERPTNIRYNIVFNYM